MYLLQGEQYSSLLKTNCLVKLLSVQLLPHPQMPLKTPVCEFGIFFFLCFTFVGMTYILVHCVC